MITPMMMKVDFWSISDVGRRRRGLFVMLFVNWLVNPFSMGDLVGMFGVQSARHWFPAPAMANQPAGRLAQECSDAAP